MFFSKLSLTWKKKDEGAVGPTPEPEDRLNHEDCVGSFICGYGNAGETPVQWYTGVEDATATLIDPRGPHVKDGCTFSGTLRKLQ